VVVNIGVGAIISPKKISRKISLRLHALLFRNTPQTEPAPLRRLAKRATYKKERTPTGKAKTKLNLAELR
jgi:hypothetical protein